MSIPSSGAPPGAPAAPPGDAIPWDWLWTKDGGLKPGQFFDIAEAHPSLMKLIKTDILPDGRALIPGCGRGYDVGALACSTRMVTGLETSPGAVTAAQAFLSKNHAEAVAKGWASVVVDDFFLHAPSSPYDLICE